MRLCTGQPGATLVPAYCETGRPVPRRTCGLGLILHISYKFSLYKSDVHIRSDVLETLSAAPWPSAALEADYHDEVARDEDALGRPAEALTSLKQAVALEPTAERRFRLGQLVFWAEGTLRARARARARTDLTFRLSDCWKKVGGCCI